MENDTLIDLLSKGLKDNLKGIKAAGEKIWKDQMLQHFTKHGIEHSENIIKILKLILGGEEEAKKKLTEHELFILLAAAYLHDIGMQSAFHAGLPAKPEYFLDDMKFIRDRHHKTSSKIILESVDPKSKNGLNCGLENCIEPNYVRFIALLARSHRKGKPGILSEQLKDDYLKTGTKIRVRLLVALMRLADELDRDYLRISMDRLKLWDIPLDSKVYWWIHHYTKAIEIENGKIKALFRIPAKYKKTKNNVDEIIFKETIDSIRQQLVEVKGILWDSTIKLDLVDEDPKSNPHNYSDNSTLQQMPENLLEFLRKKFAIQYSEEELTDKSGVTYWVDGISYSDDDELKRLTESALSHAKSEEHIQAIEDIEKASLLTIGPIEKMALKLVAGNSYLTIGKTDEAIKNYKDIYTIIKKLDTIEAKIGATAAHGNLGVAYYITGDFYKALEYYFRVLKIYKDIGNRRGEANQLGNIGHIYRDKGELDEALKYFNDSLEIHRNISYRQGEAAGLGNIGLVYKIKGNLDEALKYFNDSLEINREISYWQGEANQLGNIGLIYRDKGELDKALNYHNDALEIHRDISYRRGAANQLGNIGLIYQAKGDLDEALKYFNDSLEIHRNISYRQGEAAGLGNIGLVYQAKGDLDEALKYFNNALEINREIGCRQGEATQLGNVGLIYKDKGDSIKALKYITKALKIDREVGYREGEANQICNIGAIYSAKGDLDEALIHQQNALKIDREISCRQGEATQLANIGLIYQAKGDLDEALKYLKDALSILEMSNLASGIDVVKNAINEILKRK